jgi:hypothetical protein
MNPFARHDIRHGDTRRQNLYTYFAWLRLWNSFVNQAEFVRATVIEDDNALVSHVHL